MYETTTFLLEAPQDHFWAVLVFALVLRALVLVMVLVLLTYSCREPGRACVQYEGRTQLVARVRLRQLLI